MTKANKVATKEKPGKITDEMTENKADKSVKAPPKQKTPKVSKKGSISSKNEDPNTSEDVKEDKSVDKAKNRQDTINSLVRFAYCLEEEYPLSGLKFIEKLIGIKGGKEEPEIDEKKALTRDSHIYAELVKVMSDPKVKFKDKFDKTHNWEENFRVDSVGTQRKMYVTFDIDPDFVWESSDTKSKNT
jgi:hypothetical protein